MNLSPQQYWAVAALLILASSSAIDAEYWRPAPSNSYVPAPRVPWSPRYVPHLSVNSLAYQFLAPHNALRAALGLPRLEWDAGLAGYAASYAEQRRVDCALVHSDGPHGENIFWGSGSDWSAAEAVKSWIDEGKYYDINSNSCAYGECGHYTQIVWRTTTRLGCARIVCDNDAGVFITCNYDPPGNYIGTRPY